VDFLVETGRGAGMRGLDPAGNDAVLRELVALEAEYRGRMMVRSKCQPQIMRHVLAGDNDSPLRNYATRCPCGVQYCRITPDGKVTPCPYLPEVAGDLRVQSFDEVWSSAPVLQALRSGSPGGKCGRCEYQQVCGGCRARAFARTGEVLGADESCAYEPPGDRPMVHAAARVSYGAAVAPSLAWDDAARVRMQRIPSFVRGVVTARIESWARERGHDTITVDMLDQVRSSMPVDFSRKRPFFLEEDA
jgi:radical SAM protein with 4Fe4S-binding SPASM domain